MKVSRSKTEYLCINEGNDDETVKMEDKKVPRVKEFKYLGSTVQEMGEKYVRLVQDMYEKSETVARCAVGTTESFKVKVGLHQGSVLSPLFAAIMDRLTNEVRGEPPWTMLFADDIVICEETREEVERRH